MTTNPIRSRGEALDQAFLQLVPKTRDYFRQWTYDSPLAIRPETHERMQIIQSYYLKCMRHIAEHYLDQYQDLMPVPDRVAEILDRCRKRPYRPGAYRTDFVIGEDNDIRLIETTCRFALNGYFRAGAFQQIAQEYANSHPGIRVIDPHTPFFEAIMGYFGSFDRVCVLLGWNTAKNESKFFIPVFEAAAIPVEQISAADVPSSTHLFEHAAVISELSHEELCALPNETIDAMLESNLLNDLRTIFLIHDKRFFALLHQDRFIRSVLTTTEIDNFRINLVPTYTRHLTPDIWPKARTNKDRWIIKPHNNGMSLDVFAGSITSTADWEALFDSGRADSMVLQEYIPQRKFRGTIAGDPRDDYAAGTLLYFEEAFFGMPFLRASSHPVTNQGDDRKIAALVTPDCDQSEHRREPS